MSARIRTHTRFSILFDLSQEFGRYVSEFSRPFSLNERNRGSVANSKTRKFDGRKRRRRRIARRRKAGRHCGSGGSIFLGNADSKILAVGAAAIAGVRSARFQLAEIHFRNGEGALRPITGQTVTTIYLRRLCVDGRRLTRQDMIRIVPHSRVRLLRTIVPVNRGCC